MSIYNRTISELRSKAVMHWPEEILSSAGEISVLPLLLKTQDAFISILKIADRNPGSWATALKQNSSLSGPLFLKHLMILSDLGGEALNKLPPLANYFPRGVMEFDWKGGTSKYKLKEIQDKCSLTNSSLKVDSKKILTENEFSDKMKDVVYLLLYGSSCINDSLPQEVKECCIIGSLLGDSDAIEVFCRENYIRVSKQVSGARSNALGQFAQDYVVKRLKCLLGSNWTVTRDSRLPNVYHNIEGAGTNFDVIVKSPSDSYFGVEVSFQVTTNSTIERKAREAESLMKSVHSAGHKICYVVDGAGNINIRKNAVGTICDNSDCTVTMSDEEIGFLASYMKTIESRK
jgi:hypothetical protein